MSLWLVPAVGSCELPARLALRRRREAVTADDDLLPNFSIDLRTAQVAWKDKEGQGEEAGVAYLNYDNNVNC